MYFHQAKNIPFLFLYYEIDTIALCILKLKTIIKNDLTIIINSNNDELGTYFE